METRSILKNKIYLYLTEFFAGMSVMAVELGASRLLAPYFSSSQIVWTIIIGTIMIAMALGNIYGGRAADKNPNPDRLYIRLLIASVWIAAIPLVGKYIILGISGLLVLTISTNFLIIAALFACLIIFVFPLFLLGTVTPSLAKFTMNSLDESGKIVGRLGASNTIGSIIGTFLPTFVTIPAVGTSATFLIFSGILLVLALIYLFSSRKKMAACIVTIILFLLCSIFGASGSYAFWENDLMYEGESIYNYLQVKDTDRSVILSTNVLFGVQSIKMKDDSLTGMYYDYAMAAPVISGAAFDENSDMLILGMGSGTYASQCRRYFDGISIEGVEIDGRITELAEEYFSLPEDIAVTTYDGRAYLQATDKKYDVIMVDAYQDITIPFQMSSSEFFTLVRDHLAEDGILVVNLNMHSDDENAINAYLCDTISSVFDYVYTVDVSGSTNRILFASGMRDMPERLADGINRITNRDLQLMMLTVSDRLIEYESGGRLLTDDKAPVELLGMGVIDSLIQEELGYYKDVLKTEGISGLLG